MSGDLSTNITAFSLLTELNTCSKSFTDVITVLASQDILKVSADPEAVKYYRATLVILQNACNAAKHIASNLTAPDRGA